MKLCLPFLPALVLHTHEVCSRESPGGVFSFAVLCFSLVMLLFEMAHVHCA